MMKLWLQRHAEAEAGERMDPTRALTEQGREQVKLMGEFLVRQIGRVDLVVSSNFKRAFDTARGMADLLGCEIVETSPSLDPDGKPAIAWSDVEILTGAYCPETADAHVLVVSHHPLIGELAQYLCGVKTSDEKFHHAAVMHIHGSGPGSVMEYFVPPKVVERDEANVIEAAAAVLEELLGDEIEEFREGWVTIDGTHVFIDDTGTITKGPAGLIGKSHIGADKGTGSAKSEVVYRSTKGTSSEPQLNDQGVLYVTPDKEYSKSFGSNTQTLAVEPKKTLDLTAYKADDEVKSEDLIDTLKHHGVKVSDSLQDKLENGDGAEILQHFAQYGKKPLVDAIKAAGYDSVKINEYVADSGKSAVSMLVLDPKIATVMHESRESGTEEDEPAGLNHPKHADVLRPLRLKANRVMRSYFRRQKRLLLTSIKPALRKLTESRPSSYDIDPYGNVINIREEYDLEAKQKAAKAIPDLLPLTLTDGMRIDYTKALTAALEGGYEGLAEEFGSNSEITQDVIKEFLADHSLTKLTGGLDETTVERLRTALADTYQAGGDYDALVKAVQDEYAGFNDVRAGMIAQTEMNAAYNAGRKQLGLDMGFNEKAWNPDGTACVEICVPNVLAGWIPIEDDFESGDDAPPGHPNCDCSLDVRYNPRADAVS